MSFQNSPELTENKEQTLLILQEMKKKLVLLQKEKAEFICQNIKNLTAIIGKLVKEFQSINVNSCTPKELVEVLTKIKLFLKLTRLLVEKTNEEVNSANLENERNLFMM